MECNPSTEIASADFKKKIKIHPVIRVSLTPLNVIITEI